MFSSDIAAVAEGDSIYFINHSGKAVNNKKFTFNPKNHEYVFHGDYCAMAVDGGLLERCEASARDNYSAIIIGTK